MELRVCFHLLCAGLAGIVTIAAFFGTGFYSLYAYKPAGGLGAPRAAAPSADLATVSSIAADVPPLTAASPGVPTASVVNPTPPQSAGHPDPKRPRYASADVVIGMVTEATDAMTWVVDDQIVHLWGIRADPRSLSLSLASLVNSVRAKGPVNCRKQTHSRRYQCFTGTGEDIAAKALLAGVGRAANGASATYRGAEAEAHRQAEGGWTKP